jgi:c-di-GMP-binding flagellar brake protein YcgR
MYLKELTPGKTVNIYISRDGYKYRIVSKIEETAEHRIFVSLIARNKRVFRFLETDEVDILYKHGNSLYLWKNVKAGITELDNDQVHYFVSDKKGSIYNRRNAFRVEYGIPLVLHYFVENEDMTSYNIDDYEDEDDLSFLNTYIMDENLYEEKICQGHMRDLSESGIGIYSNNEFKINDEVSFTLSTEFGELKCRVKVVRISKANHPIFKNYYGCYFIESSRFLPRYIYNLQRKLLHTTKRED